jgi:lipoyl-dependent peroxiredoxin
MTTRTAKAHWEGTLFEGKGSVALESSGTGTFDVSWPARTEAPGGLTSPEELIAAAHASCFSMALSNQLAQAGGTIEALDTTADVTLEKTESGFAITGIKLTARGRVQGLDEAAFTAAAEQAKAGCPVSEALTGTTITLDAALEG